MIRSIRLTLTLWYVGILAVILCLFGWILYKSVAANLTSEIDEVLASKADAISDAIFGYFQAKWEAKHLIQPSPSSSQAAQLSREIEKEIKTGKFDALVTHWAQEMSELDPSERIRIIDWSGQLLYETRAFTALGIPLTKSAVAEAQRGKTVYETFNLPNWRIRVIVYPIIENGQNLYFVQTASILRQADLSLEQLRTWLLGLIPLTLVFASAIGWFLAKYALKPIGGMIEQAQQIGAEQLHERIYVPKTGDELEQLATTFNDMLARLERTFKRLRQFSAAASHELRTPLTVMKGELEVALRARRDPDEYERVLKTQLEALNEMVGIVEQLLTLARSEEGEEAVEWQPVELKALVRQASEMWRKVADEKGIRLKILAQESVWVRGEKHLLERLVANLLDNAIKHTPSKGFIGLQVWNNEENACFVVQDTGPGIAQDELPKIFDKFFRKSSAGDRGRSTGLGLGLCRWIVEAHQGQIEVSSSLGKGTTFTVWLPLSVPNV